MKETHRKAFKYKLNPTSEQLGKFEQVAGNRRFVYNALLHWSSELYKRYGLSVVYRQKLSRRVTQLKSQHEFLALSHIHTLQNAGDDLVIAYDGFFKGQRGYPRFKSKRDQRQSFRYKTGVKVQGNRVWLPKIGWVTFRKSREVEGKIKTATVSRSASGWFVSMSCEVDIQTLPERTEVVGVDLGLSHFATLSTGEQIENPRHYRRAERKLAKLQKKLSRVQRGSANRAKLRAKVAKHHERVANKRRDFQHKFTSKLISENQAIGVEDLSVKGLVRTRLAKSMSDAGMGETLRQLAYKAEWYGRTLVKADRFYPSTRTCSDCGHYQKMALSDRLFICGSCGMVKDRDLNAALNIRNVAVGHTETSKTLVEAM